MRRITALLFAAAMLTQIGYAQQSVSPVSHPNTYSELSGFSRYGTHESLSYKAVAGPRVIEQRKAMSPFEYPSVEAKVAQPYAYGWFGSTASPQWSRQFGYGRRHTQWTLK